MRLVPSRSESSIKQRKIKCDGSTDASPERFVASRLGVPQPVLELGERLLDQIEVGAAGQKEQKMGARASDRRVHRFGLVAARIVHDDDVAAAGRRDQLRFNIGPEGVSVGRAVQDPRCIDPVRLCRRDHPATLETDTLNRRAPSRQLRPSARAEITHSRRSFE